LFELYRIKDASQALSSWQLVVDEYSIKQAPSCLLLATCYLLLARWYVASSQPLATCQSLLRPSSNVKYLSTVTDNRLLFLIKHDSDYLFERQKTAAEIYLN
jgi:hypothetical protein